MDNHDCRRIGALIDFLIQRESVFFGLFFRDKTVRVSVYHTRFVVNINGSDAVALKIDRKLIIKDITEINGVVGRAVKIIVIKSCLKGKRTLFRIIRLMDFIKRRKPLL
jgi:hypothetical protein